MYKLQEKSITFKEFLILESGFGKRKKELQDEGERRERG